MKELTGKDIVKTTANGVKLYVKLNVYKIVAKYTIFAALFSLGALAASIIYILASRGGDDRS